MQELMAISAEECGELTQVCMKYLRRFDNFNDVDSKNREKLIEEAGDVMCMIELMVEYGLLTQQELSQRVLEKLAKLKQFSKLVS
jgi:NTP pyrophosphatase (non-canonical NTP hydrolase)